MREALGGARQVREVQTAADFSFAARRMAGDGWLLAGDAATFLDPIFSTGVLLALETGRAAARTLAAPLRRGEAVDPGHLERYERTVRRMVRPYYRFIEAFYAPGFCEVFLNPRPGALRAILPFLAGRTRLGPGQRIWLEFFYLVMRLNRRFRFLEDPRSAECAVSHA
jgi:2-polyprenyl-6-methoxyphenol hydroxylase-like FAD-dependent oxidoreductase